MCENHIYKLVSEAYSKALSTPDGSPQYEQWKSLGSVDAVLTDLWDERKIMNEVRCMLGAAMTIWHNYRPDVISSLTKTYSSANKAGDQYMRYALGRQASRLDDFVDAIGDINRLKRMLRNLLRGITRKISEYERINGNEFVTSVYASHLRPLTKRLPRTSSDMGECISQFFTGTQIQLDHADKKLDEMRDKILENIESASIRAEQLEMVLNLAAYARELQASTRDALSKLGGPLEDLVQNASQSISDYLQDVALIIKEEQKKPLEKPKRGSKKRNNRTKSGRRRVTVHQPAPPTAMSVTSYSKERASISQLKAAIEIASKGGGKIRIMSSEKTDVQIHYTPQWTKLFDLLDYKGKLEFVSMTQLARSGDADTPVVLLRKLNTHGNLWNRNKFSNLFVLNAKTLNSMICRLETA